MARSTISLRAIRDAIECSQETAEVLSANAQILDSEVNARFTGLQDPTYRSYLELSENMQTTIRQLAGELARISEYCQKVYTHIAHYSSTS